MHIVLNGEDRRVEPGATVLRVLEELGFNPLATVVERNTEILNRTLYGTTELSDGDTVELIRFVGGG